MISQEYWSQSIQRNKWGRLKMKETQLMSSNPPAALRWGDGRVLEQTNWFFIAWKQQVVAETKKSYEKLATLRKEFGHSGSYKSEDGTLYIGIVGFFLLGKHKPGNHKPWHFRRFWLWWCENRPGPPWGHIPRNMSGVKMVIDLFQLSSGATYDGTFSKGLPNGIGVIMILSNTNCGFLFWRLGGLGLKVVST